MTMKNNEIMLKEISRRMMTSKSEGIACGPCGIEAVDAEIVVDDNGRMVYLHGQWITECSPELFFNATNQSVYEYYKKLKSCEESEFEELITERDKITDDAKNDPFLSSIDIMDRYKVQIAALREMLMTGIKELGYELDEDEIEEEDDDDFEE